MPTPYLSRLVLTRQYFSESYDQVRRYGSRGLLVERLIGGAFVAIGIGFIASMAGDIFLPLILIGVGLLELSSSRIKKYFWLRRQGRMKGAGVEVELAIDDEGLEGRDLLPRPGRLRWSSIGRVVRTPLGLLVWPQRGMYLYLPEQSVGKEAIAFIESKVA